MDLKDKITERLKTLKNDREALAQWVVGTEQTLIQRRAQLHQFDGAIKVLEESLSPAPPAKTPAKGK